MHALKVFVASAASLTVVSFFLGFGFGKLVYRSGRKRVPRSHANEKRFPLRKLA